MQVKAVSRAAHRSIDIIFAVDKFESKYVFMNVSLLSEHTPFYGVKLTPKLYNNISHGKIDLKSVFETSENEDQCSAKIAEGNTSFDVNFPPEIPFNTFLNIIPQIIMNPSGSDVVSLSIQENAPVISVSFDVPEAYDKPKINLSTFVEVIDSLQGVIEATFHKSMKSKPLRYRQLYKGYRYEALQLIGFGPGTFTTYLRSEESVDLSGSSPIADSLVIFDELIAPVNDREKSLEVIKKFKGHVISAYKRFISAIHELDVDAFLSWAIPTSEEPFRKKISKQEVSPTFELLKETEEYEAETRILEGILIKVNKKDATWILMTEDGTEYRGYCFENDASYVDGLVVNDVKYRFVCREHMERVVATERTRFKFELMQKEVIG